MQIVYPKSFLKLLLIGFALAMLPLLFAFGNAAVYLDRLADKSRDTVTQATQTTRSSRLLVEQITLMERSARQYFVLNDVLLLENYSTAHEKFTAALNELYAMPMTKSQRDLLNSLTKRERILYDQVTASVPESPSSHSPQEVISGFISLSGEAENLLAENNRIIDRESAVLAETAARTQKMLLWQTLTLVPVAFLVAIAITFLVAQPIKRMDIAIRRLGEGNYAEPISIDGPGDLRTLGERLDWLRSQLNAVDKQKQLFLRHVSHELKTPLTAIREGSELLSDEVGGSLNQQQKEIAGILRESSLRLQKMIENLLSYSAVQFQKPQLKVERIQIDNLINDILGNYALTLNTKQIRIHREFNALQLFGDHEKVQTIIDNLISNAIKFTPASGTIMIRAYQQDQDIFIEVHDGGPGVLAKDKARLFDPFYRGDGVYESLVSGSGLGLSIAKEYADAHGGEIRLLPSDHGAHFSVRLPFKAENHE